MIEQEREEGPLPVLPLLLRRRENPLHFRDQLLLFDARPLPRVVRVLAVVLLECKVPPSSP